MPLVGKTRLAKRKHEMQEVRKENQTVTSKKHDKKCLESNNSPEFRNLKLQFELLQKKYDALEVENKGNIESIVLLKEKIKLFENQDNTKELVLETIGVQTESEEILFCNECEYPAEDFHELGEHMFEFHSKTNDTKIDCHFCDNSFDTKDILMRHRKEIHAEKVKQCIFFAMEKCDFGNELCWFNHDKASKNSF